MSENGCNQANVNDKYISRQQGQNAKFNIQYKKYLKIKLLENNIINKMLDTYVQCGYTEHGTESLHADGL